MSDHTWSTKIPRRVAAKCAIFRLSTLVVWTRAVRRELLQCCVGSPEHDFLRLLRLQLVQVHPLPSLGRLRLEE
jgi:hypothetical protein